MIIVYILITLLIIVIGLSWYISTSIFHPKTWGYQETYDFELNKGHIDFEYMSKYEIQDVYITTDNIKLHAQLIDNKSNHTIIFMHGHTFTSYGSYKYIKIFLDLNFNVLMPDQRFHGLSEGKNCTLGFKEAEDLEAWTDFVKQNLPTTKVIGYHGESMGAATVLLNGHSKDVNFIISDCAFSSLKKQTMELLWKNFKIPSLFIYPAHILSVILYKAPLLKVSPINNTQNILVPVLYVHGDSDTYINVKHVKKLAENTKDCEVYICKGANHAQSLETDFETYYHVVQNFLKGKGIL